MTGSRDEMILALSVIIINKEIIFVIVYALFYSVRFTTTSTMLRQC